MWISTYSAAGIYYKDTADCRHTGRRPNSASVRPSARSPMTDAGGEPELSWTMTDPDSTIDYLLGRRRSPNPYNGDVIDFGLSAAQRTQHIYCLGKTGTGKSTLLRNLALQDIHYNSGVTIVDPHGSFVEELLDRIPPDRADDLVYLNPADLAWPIGFNVVETPENRDDVSQRASDIVAAFKGIFGASWGPRLEYLLQFTLAALIEAPNTSLLGVTKMYISPAYQRWVVKHVQDDKTREFWTSIFPSWSQSLRNEVVLPVINKVDQVLGSPHLRNILGQVTSTINLRFMMDTRRILLVNLAKGRIGDDKANLLGSLIAAELHAAAMRRADIPETHRVPHFAFFDEFHTFTTTRFAHSLSEARKYRLFLTLAHQYTRQMSEEIRDAVFGNVSSMIAFQVGAFDAEILAREFGEDFGGPGRFTDLGAHSVCARFSSDIPFVGTTLPPMENWYGRTDKLIARSREKYGRPRAAVEDKIRRFMGR